MSKGFEAEVNLKETPNLINTAEKPLKSNNIQKNRVDINVLKARAKKIQDKQNIKNTIVITFFVIAIGFAGVYFSA